MNTLMLPATTQTIYGCSRTPSVSENVKQDFIDKAQALGFDTDKLIWVQHASAVS